jgi:hypothetical protein
VITFTSAKWFSMPRSQKRTSSSGLVAVDLRSFIVPESDGIVFVYRSNYEGLLGKRVRRLPDRGPP